jgi:hypothetical protein
MRSVLEDFQVHIDTGLYGMEVEPNVKCEDCLNFSLTGGMLAHKDNILDP